MCESLLDTALWLSAQSQKFGRDEEAASTVEMVIMMSASITLGLAATSMIKNGVENLATDVGGFLSDYTITTSFDDGANTEPNGN